MATIREATQQDIEGIAALFNSDPNYSDRWFNTPGGIRSHDEQLRRFNLEAIARFVAVDKGEIVGCVAAEQFYLSDPNLPNGKVAEVKKAFVKPSHRRKGISSQLLDVVEHEIRKADYDFAVALAVCGHPNSQNLLLKKDYMVTGFAPNFINASLTMTSPRESLLYVVKAISESGKASSESRRTVYVPPEAFGVVAAAYSAAGLSHLREIVVDDKTAVTESDRRWVATNLIAQGRGNPAGGPTLPHVTTDITKSERVGRVKAALEVGVPIGVLPIGTDRIIVNLVPSGLTFDPSKVSLADKARNLADVVGVAYNAKAIAGPQ